MFFNCLLVCHLILNSVCAVEISSNSYLDSNAAGQPRVKRYHYPKPENWGYPYSSSNPEYTYSHSQYQDGYHYHEPHYGPDVPSTYQGPQNYEYFSSGPSYFEPALPVHPTGYTNEQPIYTKEPNRDDQKFPVPQPFPEFIPNQNISAAEISSPANEDRLSRPTSVDYGAFINSSIFGSGSEYSSLTISPTGSLIAVPFSEDETATGGSATAAAIQCDQPYKRPNMPNFQAPGRTISEVKCYEYIWELRIRSEMETRNRTCTTQRSKRSQFGLYEEYRHPPTQFQPEIPQQNWFEQATPSPQIFPENQSNESSEGTGTIIGSAFGIAFMEAQAEEFPHMAAIGWRGVEEDYVFKCGGSLISRNFVLTAAHCTAAAPDPAIVDSVPSIVRIGDINIGVQADGQTFTQKRRRRQAGNPGRLDVAITNIITHEQYNPNMKYYDIALLQLESELEFNKHLQPACIWNNINTSNRIRKAVAAGWGIVNLADRRTALKLQVGELDIIDTETCNRLLLPSFGQKLSQVVDHQLCAGILAGGKDVCQGDSGGPLQVKIQLPIKDQGSMHTILGIISAGVGCAKPDTPGVYTRVTSFVDWIERNVWQ